MNTIHAYFDGNTVYPLEQSSVQNDQFRTESTHKKERPIGFLDGKATAYFADDWELDFEQFCAL